MTLYYHDLKVLARLALSLSHKTTVIWLPKLHQTG